MDGDQSSNGRTFLEGLGGELGVLSSTLAAYAAQEARRRRGVAREGVTGARVGALLAARRARAARFGIDLAHPGWSLLMALFRAHLDGEPARLSRVAADAGVAMTTTLRWIDALVQAGLIVREAAPDRQGGVLLALTPRGRAAIEAYFVALQIGWDDADAPKRSA